MTAPAREAISGVNFARIPRAASPHDRHECETFAHGPKDALKFGLGELRINPIDGASPPGSGGDGSSWVPFVSCRGEDFRHPMSSAGAPHGKARSGRSTQSGRGSPRDRLAGPRLLGPQRGRPTWTMSKQTTNSSGRFCASPGPERLLSGSNAPLEGQDLLRHRARLAEFALFEEVPPWPSPSAKSRPRGAT